MKRLVLIEFNELCPALLSQWMKAGLLPNFSAFHSRSDVFVTEADEAQAPNLEPWIQWYSLHTGLPFSKHHVFHLADGPLASHPDIWNVLLAKGVSVCNFSSMNARRIAGPGAIYLPDPWCSSQKSYPAELNIFQDVVSSQVKEYSNKDNRLAPVTLARFLAFLAIHGLSAGTVLAILRQLSGETFDRRSAWKRAVLLDMLQFDVFRHYFYRAQPAFSTFFVNSTAHLQHSYWRHMDPDAFTARPDASEIARHKDSILYGYQRMDRLLGKFMKLKPKETTLVFATALSQQPYLKYEAIGGQRFYRPKSVEQFLARLDLHPVRVDAVMTHQFIARFRNETEAEQAKARLSAVRTDFGDVIGIDPAEPGSIYFGCQLRTQLPPDTKLSLGGAQADGNQTLDFFDLFYQIEGLKSGRHHPDGCLWIRRGAHNVHPGKVSILDVVPTVLDFFGVPAVGLEGQSLLGRGSAPIPPVGIAAE